MRSAQPAVASDDAELGAGVFDLDRVVGAVDLAVDLLY
jgi:hypothetical protein